MPGHHVDTILLPIVITPDISRGLEPKEAVGTACRLYAAHPATFRRGVYEGYRLVAIHEYCTACRVCVSRQKFNGDA